MVLSGALVNVVPLLYDYSGMTLEALLCLTERALKGSAVQSIGIIAEGNSEEIYLIEGVTCLVNLLLMCVVQIQNTCDAPSAKLGHPHVLAV